LIYKAKLLVDEALLSSYSKINFYCSKISFLVKEDGETIHMVKKPEPQPGESQ